MNIVISFFTAGRMTTWNSSLWFLKSKKLIIGIKKMIQLNLDITRTENKALGKE